MKVLFLRHALAGSAETYLKSNSNDDLRPITKEGEKKTALLSGKLSFLYKDVKVILSSPLVRARQTAKYLEKELGLEAKITEALRHEKEPEEILKEIKKWRKHKMIALVGHNPHFTKCLSYFLGSKERLNIEVKKSSFILIEFDDLDKGEAFLHFAIPPKILEAFC